MYTAKGLLLLISLTLISCSQFRTTKPEASNSCLEKRGALDIGSGTSKLVVAVVNKCNNTIDNVLFEAHRVIGFKEQLQKSKDGRFSSAITSSAINELRNLMQLAYSQGAMNIRSVATSAFRTAKNASETAEIISKTLNLPIKIITQTDESLFAYNAAVSQARTKSIITNADTKIAVWDIGGGSMQIVKSSKNGQTIYLGKLASISFKNKVLKKLSKRTESPNPLKKKNAVEAMTLARTYSNKFAKPIIGSLKDYKVIGAGGVHYYSVKGQINSIFNYYERGELLETLLERAELTDKTLGGKYAKTDVTNLALVLGFMQSLSIEKVIPLKINMAHGVLTSPSLWK